MGLLYFSLYAQKALVFQYLQTNEQALLTSDTDDLLQ